MSKSKRQITLRVLTAVMSVALTQNYVGMSVMAQNITATQEELVQSSEVESTPTERIETTEKVAKVGTVLEFSRALNQNDVDRIVLTTNTLNIQNNIYVNRTRPIIIDGEGTKKIIIRSTATLIHSAAALEVTYENINLETYGNTANAIALNGEASVLRFKNIKHVGQSLGKVQTGTIIFEGTNESKQDDDFTLLAAKSVILEKDATLDVSAQQNFVEFFGEGEFRIKENAQFKLNYLSKKYDDYVMIGATKQAYTRVTVEANA